MVAEMDILSRRISFFLVHNYCCLDIEERRGEKKRVSPNSRHA